MNFLKSPNKKTMLTRDIKISRGLSKLINGESVGPFQGYPDIFIENPQYRSSYFEMFSKAQIVEIANSGR